MANRTPTNLQFSCESKELKRYLQESINNLTNYPKLQPKDNYNVKPPHSPIQLTTKIPKIRVKWGQQLRITRIDACNRSDLINKRKTNFSLQPMAGGEEPRDGTSTDAMGSGLLDDCFN